MLLWKTRKAQSRESLHLWSIKSCYKISTILFLVDTLVLNRRRTSYIRHNLDFPRSSCIVIMFLSKRFGMSCIPPWFSTFPAYFIAGWCHCYIYGGMPCLLIHPGLCVKVQQFLYCTKVLEKSTACLLIQHVLYWSPESRCLWRGRLFMSPCIKALGIYQPFGGGLL